MHSRIDPTAWLFAGPPEVSIYAMRLLIWGLCVCVSRVLVSVVLSSFVAPFSTDALGVSLPLVARCLGAASVFGGGSRGFDACGGYVCGSSGEGGGSVGHVVMFRMGLLLAVTSFVLVSL